jgi:Phosphotransferase enzyme family
MMLTRQQLEAIVARAFPGERLVESRELAAGRYALVLPGGQRLAAHVYETGDAAATAAAALRRLRAEIDLPIPQLRASDPLGETAGQPYLLLSELSGEPLERALPRIGDEQLYNLGRRLGELLCRVHRLACERYGALTGEDSATARDERDYGLARFGGELERCSDLGILDRRGADELRDWFAQEFTPAGRQPALICGGATPATILVQQSEGRWWVSGLLGWEHALGWSPAWEHVTFFDAAGGPHYFSLRVGYGNGYDEQTTRAYEQVREHAMAPYRALLVLQRLRESFASGDMAMGERRRELLRGLVRATVRESRSEEEEEEEDRG